MKRSHVIRGLTTAAAFSLASCQEFTPISSPSWETSQAMLTSTQQWLDQWNTMQSQYYDEAWNDAWNATQYDNQAWNMTQFDNMYNIPVYNASAPQQQQSSSSSSSTQQKQQQQQQQSTQNTTISFVIPPVFYSGSSTYKASFPVSVQGAQCECNQVGSHLTCVSSTYPLSSSVLSNILASALQTVSQENQSQSSSSSSSSQTILYPGFQINGQSSSSSSSSSSQQSSGSVPPSTSFYYNFTEQFPSQSSSSSSQSQSSSSSQQSVSAPVLSWWNQTAQWWSANMTQEANYTQQQNVTVQGLTLLQYQYFMAEGYQCTYSTGFLVGVTPNYSCILPQSLVYGQQSQSSSSQSESSQPLQGSSGSSTPTPISFPPQPVPQQQNLTNATCQCDVSQQDIQDLQRSMNFLAQFFISFVNQTQSQLNYVNETMDYMYGQLLQANSSWAQVDKSALLAAADIKTLQKQVQQLQGSAVSSSSKSSGVAQQLQTSSSYPSQQQQYPVISSSSSSVVQGAVTIEDVKNYFQLNGIQVSKRWMISEEDNTGRLFIRDLVATEEGNVDARYTLRNGTMVNL